MIRIRTYKNEDLLNIEAQPAQKVETGLFNPMKEAEAESYTIYDDTNNFIICILVFTPVSEERCIIGALLSAQAGKYFVGLRRIIYNFLNIYNFTRLECMVRASFPQGHRLIKLLGFSLEGTLRKFCKGEDYCIYARVK